ncbi:MAG: hypothetical protein FWD78_15530 [Treponema sp.]|nr:hypothetical protein [Treponema sp.]
MNNSKKLAFGLMAALIVGPSVSGISAAENKPLLNIEAADNGGNGMNKLIEANKKIENAVVTGYKAIENGVVTGYKAIEDGVVNGYKKIENKFVGAFLTSGTEPKEAGK